jgi:hypothetical protein
MPALTRPAPDLINLAARCFPLLPRAKPACRPLSDRVERVRRHAETARQTGSLEHAAKALNLAALIYSDSTMAHQARALCWRQFEVFAAGGPYDEAMAKTAIQPLVNIGRLHTRAGDNSTAYQLHQAMFHGARHSTPTEIDNRSIDLAAIAQPGHARRALVQSLWMVLLSDGLRALCRAGHWGQAHQHAQTHHGIGERLLDGRQIAIIAAAINGDLPKACTLIDRAVVTEPWERCIATCLRVLAGALAGRRSTADIDTMLHTYEALDMPSEHTLFLIRTGLAVVDLAPHHDTTAAIRKIEEIISSDSDAYVAADLVHHTPSLPLRPEISATLHKTVAAAGLGQRLPAERNAMLTTAADTAIDALRMIILPR